MAALEFLDVVADRGEAEGMAFLKSLAGLRFGRTSARMSSTLRVVKDHYSL
jgi:hypothetical protein